MTQATQTEEPLEAAPSESRRGWFRRHRALTVVLAAVLILGLALLGLAWTINHKLDQIPRLSFDGDAALAQEYDEGLNILLVGVDSGDAGGPGVKELAEKGWQAGRFRSDTLMLLHLDADRENASLVSFPRDSWVDVPGHGQQKINAAFSFGGPELLVETMKGLGLTSIHHLVAIDWDGFRYLTDKLGGVEIDGSLLKGQEALDYVRERKSLPRGDFDRIQRQQNFLRAVFTKLADGGTLRSPSKLLGALDWAGGDVLVDENLTNGRIRSLALSLRSFSADELAYYTAPNKGSGMVGAASVVLLDLPLTRELLGAAVDDELGEFLAGHPGIERLGDEGNVD